MSASGAAARHEEPSAAEYERRLKPGIGLPQVAAPARSALRRSAVDGLRAAHQPPDALRRRPPDALAASPYQLVEQPPTSTVHVTGRIAAIARPSTSKPPARRVKTKAEATYQSGQTG